MIVTSRKKKISKDIETLPTYVKEEAAKQIKILQESATLIELANVRKMEGTDEPYYRLSFGKYRMMMYYYRETDTVKILSITHRKDTYKKQNLPWRN